MRIKDAALDTVCGFTSTLPAFEEPEIAFAGKSNVGKSSLINTLMNRKRLARVGETPGKTRTINFYRVRAGADEKERTADGAEVPAADRSFFLVDLPGYGYANVSQEEKARWGQMIERYLNTSRNLRLVFLLVDIRHEPNANDLQMHDWVAASGFSPVIIATKADKIKRSQLQKQVKMLRETLKVPGTVPVIPFSAQTRQGAEEILRVMEEIVTRPEGGM